MGDLDDLANAADGRLYPAQQQYEEPAYQQPEPQWQQPAACQYQPRRPRPAPWYLGIMLGAGVLYVVGGFYVLAGLFVLLTAGDGSSREASVFWSMRVALGIALFGA